MNSLISYFEPYSKEITLPFPDAKSEEFRYSTVIDQLSQLSIQTGSGKKITLDHPSDYIFSSDHSLDTCPTITYDKLPKNFHRYNSYFKQASLAKNKNIYEITCDKDQIHLDFTATQHSVMDDKIYIHIPAEKTVQVYLDFYTEENTLSIPTIFIDAQANSHVELIYTVDAQKNKGLLAPSFELIAEEKSHVSLQTFTEGIQNHRLTFIGFCAGADSHIDLRTGFHLQQQETCDLYVRIYHEAKNSTSNQMIKTVAFDNSQMNFNGLIYANGEAHNIYAYQMLKGMILGEDAKILARPQLDIEYFELACSHGVSIGGFDPEELFYLKSRGIQTKDVYPLLLYGFFSEPFMEIPLEKHWINRIKTLLGTAQI